MKIKGLKARRTSIWLLAGVASLVILFNPDIRNSASSASTESQTSIIPAPQAVKSLPGGSHTTTNHAQDGAQVKAQVKSDQGSSGESDRSAAAVPDQTINTAGNSIYRVHVDASGRYTATTGAAHPAGSGLNVLFGGGRPGTTFNTIRSYTSGIDYVQRPGNSSLAPFASTVPIGTTGFRTTYTLPGPPTTPDRLAIIQDVNVNGATFDDSTIEVTTTIINHGEAPVELGVRYLWDYQIAADDGPTFQEVGPDGPVRINEAEFTNPEFAQYRIVDNDSNPNSPTFFISGTAAGPVTLRPRPSAPDSLRYTCWGDAFNTTFDYTVNPSRSVATVSDCTENPGGDTAVLYYFGRNRASAITLPAGGRQTISASMFLAPPAGADLAITQTASPSQVNAGANVTYEIKVTNLDARNTARFVTVTDRLPSALTPVSCAATGGGVCSGSGNNLAVTFPSLTPGATETVTLVATANCANAEGGVITNTASVSSSTPDPNSANNTAATTVNLISSAAQLRLSDGGSSLDFGAVPAARELNPNPPSRTFTLENTGCASLPLNLAINRTGSDATNGRIANTDDSALFPVRIINADGTETPLSVSPGSPPVQIPGGQSRRFRVQFNPLIPILAGRTAELFANQVIPDVITSQLAIASGAGAPLTINLTGRVSTPAKMIHPSDSRLEPLVVFTRAGDEFTIECSAHDSNLDLRQARYQFLDQNDRPVGTGADVGLLQPIAQRNLVRGQSFTIIQKFTGASQRPEINKVQVTLLDGETTVTTASAVLGVTEAAIASVSAASFLNTALASESIVSSFGSGLAPGAQAAATTPLPTLLSGVTVRVRDGAGVERASPLFFVSPGQINFQIPPGTMVGAATVSVVRENRIAARGVVQIANASPGLFAANANGQGAAAAVALRIGANGSQRFEPVAQFDAAQNRFVTRSLDFGPSGEQLYLALFGAGVRFRRSSTPVVVRIGGVESPAIFAGAQGGFVGLDQINVLVPRDLAGRGEVDVTVTLEGRTSNPVRVRFGGAASALPATRAEMVNDQNVGASAVSREAAAAILLPVLKLTPDPAPQSGSRGVIRRNGGTKEK